MRCAPQSGMPVQTQVLLNVLGRKKPGSNLGEIHPFRVNVQNFFHPYLMFSFRIYKRIVRAHRANRLPRFGRHGRGTTAPAVRLPSPEQAISFAEPGDHSCRTEFQCRSSVPPHGKECRP